MKEDMIRHGYRRLAWGKDMNVRCSLACAACCCVNSTYNNLLCEKRISIALNFL